MVTTVKTKGRPSDKDIDWFVKNIGPRTHWMPKSIGGKGWRFETSHGEWYLTMDDDKMMTYYLLIR